MEICPLRRSKFQSALPVRGATVPTSVYPRNDVISIHAPRAGSDSVFPFPRETRSEFQSTLPVRGATNFIIHCIFSMSNFNPRSPCGERLKKKYRVFYTLEFQSTLPVRGATIAQLHASVAPDVFQSTLPVRGATQPNQVFLVH